METPPLVFTFKVHFGERIEKEEHRNGCAKCRPESCETGARTRLLKSSKMLNVLAKEASSSSPLPSLLSSPKEASVQQPVGFT